ncbi:endonuclease [Escherichia phage EJP2]|nr:endonuclease [Escherichia phage EJP2]
MKRRLKNPDDAAKYRKELLKAQGGIDPILQIPITKPVLDHYHQDNQHCRGVLQNEVNGWEGRVQNSFNRCVRHLTDKPLYEVLRNLADYLEHHNNIPPEEQVIHHTALTVDVKKFKALPAKQQCEVLSSLGTEPETNVKKRANQARTLIKEGKLDMRLIKKGA